MQASASGEISFPQALHGTRAILLPPCICVAWAMTVLDCSDALRARDGARPVTCDSRPATSYPTWYNAPSHPHPANADASPLQARCLLAAEVGDLDVSRHTQVSADVF